MKTLLSTAVCIFSVFIVCAQNNEHTAFVLSGFEGDLSKAWGGPHTKLFPETDTSFVKEGKQSGTWTNLTVNMWLTLLDCPSDWSPYNTLSFWMYAPSASGEEFRITVNSETTQSVKGNYFLYTFKNDWTGWKQVIIPFTGMKRNRAPIGWHAINGFMIAPSRRDIPPGLVFRLDDMRLIRGDAAAAATPASSSVPRSAIKTELTALVRSPAWTAAGSTAALVAVGNDGRLVYGKDPDGDRIPDYSLAGYRGGGVAIPDVPVKKTLTPSGDDDTAAIQQAVDELSLLPMEAGFRGAILLKKGKYTIHDTITIKASGVVLRGEGAGFGGTWIFHKRLVNDPAKTQYVHFPIREKGVVPTFLTESGKLTTAKFADILGNRVGSGERVLRLSDTSKLAQGQSIVVVCQHTKKWVDDLGLSEWWKKPEEFSLKWERSIASIDNVKNEITLNVPLTSIIDNAQGHASGELHLVTEETRLSNIGIEDMLAASDYDRSKIDKDGFYVDENHPNQFFRFYNARNGWIRRVVGLYYSYGLVRCGGSSFLTVEDCAMLDGVSTDTPKTHSGARKYYFDLSGSQVLVQRCYGRYSRHCFAANGTCTGGVYLDCLSEKGHLGSEGHQRWSHGFLYDSVYADTSINATAVRGDHGFRMASTMIWNCYIDQKRVWEAEIYIAAIPGMVWNYAVGNLSRGGKGYWVNQDGNEKPTLGQLGVSESCNAYASPRSLYRAQLEDRLGPDAVSMVTTPLQGQRGSVWIDLSGKYSALPEYASPDELPWKGYEDWVVSFERNRTDNR
ncbi:MAG: hypothetical protein HZC28_13010 [Spirochaetes bacterium]|nr:hypothetical protein [Spirochaetota bacterium]